MAVVFRTPDAAPKPETLNRGLKVPVLVWAHAPDLLSLIAYDNKRRFQYAGTLDDIRSQHVDTGVWPLWLAATHGHSNKIAEEIDDNDLAVAWFWDQPREELGGTAAF